MSFMNPKYAVQTCVLSKRWQSLWKSLPYLDFNIESFLFKGELLGRDDPEGDPLIHSFNNFIAQVLVRRHHTNLFTVSVYSCCEKVFVKGSGLNLIIYPVDPERSAIVVEKLIAYAVDHNVQQLTILWGRDGAFELPVSFYTCQSLATVYVGGITQLSKFLALPALKSLHLEQIEMSQSFSHPRNFSGCSNLETFIISGDVFLPEETTLFINAPNLKRLELSFGRNYKGNSSNTCKVLLDAPRLTTFKYRGYVPIVYSSDELASIDDAYFDIYNHYIYKWLLKSLYVLSTFSV